MADVHALGSSPTTCSFFLHKESRCNDAIQIALVIITTLGIAVFAASYFSIPATIGYFGISTAVISLISLKIFRSYSSSDLDRAIDACTTFSEMENIMNKAQMTVSWLGVRQLNAEGINGTSTLDHMARRVEKKIASHLKDEAVVTREMTTGKTFVYGDQNEEKIGRNLVIRIWHWFNESEKTIDNENIFTQICYWTPRFFKAIISFNDIRNRYKGYENGMRCTIGFFSHPRKPGDENMPPKWGTIE